MQMCRSVMWRMSVRTGVLTKDEETRSFMDYVHQRGGLHSVNAQAFSCYLLLSMICLPSLYLRCNRDVKGIIVSVRVYQLLSCIKKLHGRQSYLSPGY